MGTIYQITIKADTAKDFIEKWIKEMKEVTRPLDTTYNSHREAVMYRDGCVDTLFALSSSFRLWYKTHFVDSLNMAIPLCEPIESLELGRATYNALKRTGIDQVYQIYKYSMEKGVGKIRGIGKQAINDINTCLDKAGLPEIYA